MNLEDIISEISRTQKDRYHMISLKCRTHKSRKQGHRSDQRRRGLGDTDQRVRNFSYVGLVSSGNVVYSMGTTVNTVQDTWNLVGGYLGSVLTTNAQKITT